MNARLNRFLSMLFNTALIATLLLAALPTGEAKAASFTASTYTELNNAIISANSNGQADTITLTADIVLTAALPGINSIITIDGNGYSLIGGTNIRGLHVMNGGNLTLNFVTIRNGNATASSNPAAFGGGIYNAGTLTINNCVIRNNSATGNGGGIYNLQNATLTIDRSSISNNSATNGGGVVNIQPTSTMTIINSTFSGNTATSDGGGLRNNGVMDIQNSTFTGNSASNGGGIYNTTTNLTLNRNIISGNTSSSGGREIHSTVAITPDNYNVYSHNGLTTENALFGVTVGTTDYNASSNASNFPLASILDATLRDNGGPTQTHALPSGSPAIDRAPSAACTASPINGIDQRGAARSYNSTCDSGAYEYRNPTPLSSPAINTNYTIENLTLNFSSLGSLTSVTVEEMGPGVDHPLATGNSGTHLHTGNWWYITGNASDFSVSITLPHTSADASSRVCKWPGGLGGYGWDCNPNNTTYVANTSVTRSGITSFSDWAVGQNVGPTAITLTTFAARAGLPQVVMLLAASLLVIVSLWAVWRLKKQA